MSKQRWLALAALAVPVLAAGYLMLRGLGWNALGPAEVKGVPAGHQEIVWLAPATGGEAWERLVAAVKNLTADWPKTYPQAPLLVPSFQNAFISLTADVPEISLHFAGHEKSKLWIRWYKLSSENNAAAWIESLAKRKPPPLAIIGGENSDRAYAIARTLEERRKDWRGSAPLFLITTATAERVYPDAFADPYPKDPESYPKLTEVYKDATFRFSFTNTVMAEAMLDFVRQRPEIWPASSPAAPLAASVVAQGQPLTAVAVLLGTHTLRPTTLTAAAWEDDPYSRDLAERFPRLFQPLTSVRSSIAYSVGDVDQPNLYEAIEVGNFLKAHRPEYNHLLLLPTNAQRARRFLRDMYLRDPAKVKNLVVVSGDSISFNNIYRDYEVVWNFLDPPVPLLFFSHRNPVDEKAGFGQLDPETGRPSKTGTQDLLLNRDILTALVQAAMPGYVPLGDAKQFAERLRGMEWRKGLVFHPDTLPVLPGDPPGTRGVLLFDEEGNRRTRTGERIILLKPDLNTLQAEITFWGRINDPADLTWRALGKPLSLLGRPGGAGQ